MELTELESLSSYEIDQAICSLESKLKKAITENEAIEQRRLAIQKKMLELQLEKKGLEADLSQRKSDMKAMDIDLKILRSKFWAVKNEGR